MYPNSYDVPIARLVARQILSCAPATPVREVARRMFAERCSSIVVMKDEQVVGIWTEHDALSAGDNPRDLDRPVSEVMSQDVKYCFEDEDSAHVAQNMGELQVRRLPVLNRDKRLVGIVSLGDLALKKKSDAADALKGVSRHT